jgi:hypothetical protein
LLLLPLLLPLLLLLLLLCNNTASASAAPLPGLQVVKPFFEHVHAVQLLFRRSSGGGAAVAW